MALAIWEDRADAEFADRIVLVGVCQPGRVYFLHAE